MSDVDKLLAQAQIGLAAIFAFGFFAIVFFMMLWHKNLTDTELTVLTGLLSVMGTLLTLQMNFFFARTRPAALPDPTMTTTTTTTPAPIASGVSTNVTPLTPSSPPAAT